MKKYFYLAAIILPLLFCSCSNDSDDSTNPTTDNTVSLAIDSQTLLNDYTITYSVSVTGDGNINEISYLNENGITVSINDVNITSNTWTKTLNISQSKSVAMTAKGTLSKGSIIINIDGVNGNSTIHFTKSETRS
jgi:hypothetical protein